MDVARVARALNHLSEDAFLFESEGEDLLELVDEYFGDTAPTGKIRPNLLNFMNIHIHNNNNNNNNRR